MLFEWFHTTATVRAINSALLQRPHIKVAKAKDHSNTGLHWYNFSYFDQRIQKPVKGNAADFSDKKAVLKTWGEFVERQSFRECVKNGSPSVQTSSGFASHTSAEKAKNSALAELIERDIFLTCWLSNTAAHQIPAAKIKQRVRSFKKLTQLSDLGFEVKLGIFGKCMGQLVGIVAVYSQNQFAIATAAKTTIEELIDQLVREATVTVSDLRSPVAPTAIPELTNDAEPIDHLRFYLNHSGKAFCETWIRGNSEEYRTFPGFSYELKDETNDLAKETGYVVYQATSVECQNLWFGPTTPAVVNLERIKQVSNKNLSYEDLNCASHPLS